MMKKLALGFFVSTLLIASQYANAQTTTNTTTQNTVVSQPKAADWKEKTEFHKVMAQTFHPMEDGNFEPIRTRSAELLDKAMAWQNSKAPAGVDQQKVATTLRTLVHQIRELNLKIINKTATDAVIKDELSKIHDTFHEVAGMCSPGDHEGHEGHEGHDHK